MKTSCLALRRLNHCVVLILSRTVDNIRAHMITRIFKSCARRSVNVPLAPMRIARHSCSALTSWIVKSRVLWISTSLAQSAFMRSVSVRKSYKQSGTPCRQRWTIWKCRKRKRGSQRRKPCLSSFDAVIETGTMDEKRDLLQELIKEIVVLPTKGELDIVWNF